MSRHETLTAFRDAAVTIRAILRQYDGATEGAALEALDLQMTQAEREDAEAQAYASALATAFGE